MSIKLSVPKNTNYCATIVKVGNIITLPKLDKVVAAIVAGNQVIVGKDTPVGEIGVFFPVECKFSEKFAFENNLNSDATLNKDSTKKGYTSKGRLKCVAFQGHKSEGLYLPLSSLESFLSKDEIASLAVGMEFDELNGQAICEKYVPKTDHIKNGSPNSGKNQANARGEKKVPRLVEEQFKFHDDTEQLKKNAGKIRPTDVISITDKWHGCVSFDTTVDTKEYGIITIGEVVDKKLEVHVKSFDTVKKEICFSKVEQHFCMKDDGEWFEIELENGKKIKITGNNPVWIPEISDYVKVENLIEGMSVLVS